MSESDEAGDGAAELVKDQMMPMGPCWLSDEFVIFIPRTTGSH